jgi:hypothetical protein
MHWGHTCEGTEDVSVTCTLGVSSTDLPLLFPGPTLALDSAIEPTALRLAARVAAVRLVLLLRLSLAVARLDSLFCKAVCSLSKLACSASNTRSSSFIMRRCSLRSWCTWPTCFCTSNPCHLCPILNTSTSFVPVFDWFSASEHLSCVIFCKRSVIHRCSSMACLHGCRQHVQLCSDAVSLCSIKEWLDERMTKKSSATQTTLSQSCIPRLRVYTNCKQTHHR